MNFLSINRKAVKKNLHVWYSSVWLLFYESNLVCESVVRDLTSVRESAIFLPFL